MSQTQSTNQKNVRERRKKPSRQHAKKDALTFTRLQQHQQAFLQWLAGSNEQSLAQYQWVR